MHFDACMYYIHVAIVSPTCIWLTPSLNWIRSVWLRLQVYVLLWKACTISHWDRNMAVFYNPPPPPNKKETDELIPFTTFIPITDWVKYQQHIQALWKGVTNVTLSLLANSTFHTSMHMHKQKQWKKNAVLMSHVINYAVWPNNSIRCFDMIFIITVTTAICIKLLSHLSLKIKAVYCWMPNLHNGYDI